MKPSLRSKGLAAATASAFFLGMAPVFGKYAIRLGVPPLGVVAFRTVSATALLFLVILLFSRRNLYIYPAGMLGCFLAGFLNGIGSLMYYSALGRIDASLGQLLYSLYPLILAIWLWMDKQPPSKLTIVRFVIILPAIYLLTQSIQTSVDLLGVLMMLAAAALYALHLPINQRVLYDMPAPTVTLYTLLAMSAVVVPAYLIGGKSIFPAVNNAWGAMVGITMVTFLSRLTLFLGVKHIGGMQTAILGLGELLVTLMVSHLWLGERLSTQQWVGASILAVSLGLTLLEKSSSRPLQQGGWLSWIGSHGIPKDLSWPQK